MEEPKDEVDKKRTHPTRTEQDVMHGGGWLRLEGTRKQAVAGEKWRKNLLR